MAKGITAYLKGLGRTEENENPPPSSESNFPWRLRRKGRPTSNLPQSYHPRRPRFTLATLSTSELSTTSKRGDVSPNDQNSSAMARSVDISAPIASPGWSNSYLDSSLDPARRYPEEITDEASRFVTTRSPPKAVPSLSWKSNTLETQKSHPHSSTRAIQTQDESSGKNPKRWKPLPDSPRLKRTCSEKRVGTRYTSAPPREVCIHSRETINNSEQATSRARTLTDNKSNNRTTASGAIMLKFASSSNLSTRAGVVDGWDNRIDPNTFLKVGETLSRQKSPNRKAVASRNQTRDPNGMQAADRYNSVPLLVIKGGQTQPALPIAPPPSFPPPLNPMQKMERRLKELEEQVQVLKSNFSPPSSLVQKKTTFV